MKLHEFRLLIDTIDNNTAHDDYDVVVKISKPGTVIGAVPTSSVKSVYQGFDWDTGKIIITTEDILSNKFNYDKEINILEQFVYRLQEQTLQSTLDNRICTFNTIEKVKNQMITKLKNE